MGQSTNAVLFYGYCWLEETHRPWAITKYGEDEEEDEEDEDEEEDDGEDEDKEDDDWEERYAHAKGLTHPTESYPDTRGHYSQLKERALTPDEQAVVKTYEAYWAKKRELVEASGCEVDTHCSGECPMPYVAVKASTITSYRGDMTEVKSLSVEIDWNEKLKNFCKVLGINVSGMEPKWWLVSYWG